MDRVSNFVNNLELKSKWNHFSESVLSHETVKKIVAFTSESFKNVSLPSLRNSKWTYIVTGGVLLLGCVLKIRSLLKANTDLKEKTPTTNVQVFVLGLDGAVAPATSFQETLPESEIDLDARVKDLEKTVKKQQKALNLKQSQLTGAVFFAQKQGAERKERNSFIEDLKAQLGHLKAALVQEEGEKKGLLAQLSQKEQRIQALESQWDNFQAICADLDESFEKFEKNVGLPASDTA